MNPVTNQLLEMRKRLMRFRKQLEASQGNSAETQHTDFIHLRFGSANGSGNELCSKNKNPKYIKFVGVCSG